MNTTSVKKKKTRTIDYFNNKNNFCFADIKLPPFSYRCITQISAYKKVKSKKAGKSFFTC